MRRMNKLALAILFCGFALAGCTEDNLFYLATDNPSQIISYTSFLSNCSTVNNVNITNAWGVCGAKHNVLTTYTSSTNWSVTCCDYQANKCDNKIQNNFTDICSYDVANSSSFSWEYKNGGFVGLCCDFRTGLCYEQPNADITLNNSCQSNYTMVTSTIYQNNSDWNAWCCISGGLNQ